MIPRYAAAQEAARRGPLFVVLNAGSGHQDSTETRAVISRVLKEAHREHEFLLIEDASTVQAIARRAVQKAQERSGVVVAAGGDGTINSVAQAVLGSGRPFGVLPQGTFNYFGRSNGIPQKTEAAARALLGASVAPVQVGRVNDRVFLVNASVGLYPKLLEDREAFKKQLGRSRVVAIISGIVTLLRSPRPMRLSIESKGAAVRLTTSTLFVGNNHLQLEQVGIEEADANAVEQGQLTAIVLGPLGRLAMLGLLVRGALGRLGGAENVSSHPFRRITVTPHGMRKIKVATDGEVTRMRTPLHFEVAPEPLLLMVPAPADRAEAT